MSIDIQRPSPATAPAVRGPSSSWYWVAGVLAAAGVFAAVAWVLGAVAGLNDHVDRFPRTGVPGEVSAQIDTPDSYFVYFEGSAEVTLDRLGVTLSGPAGEPVAVRPVDGGVVYDMTERAIGHAVGEFQASTTGTYELTATGDAAGATIAIGDSLTDDVLPPLVGAGLLLLLTWGGAIAIAIVTGVRRSRPSTFA